MKKQIECKITLFGQDISWADFTERMRRCNKAQNFKPLWKTLGRDKIKVLEKLIKGER